MKRKRMLYLLALCLGFSGVVAKTTWATNTPADATITITPVANVSLSVSPTTYAFGTLDISASSNSASAVSLTNNGQVDVSVTKQITNQSNPAGWTAGASAALDTYVLYVATSTTRPGVSDFTTGAHAFGALSNVTSLEGLGGGNPIVTNPAGILPSVNLWFRLDMPTTVSSQIAREITVRFTGTAQ